MGNIITRTLKNGRVARYAQYVELDGQRVTRSTKAKTPDDAQKWLERAETRVAAGLPGDARPRRDDTPKEPELTVRALCERFCGYTEAKETRFKAGAGDENTDPVDYRRGSWSALNKHVLPTLGDRAIAELRRVDVIALKDTLTTSRSAWIVSRVLRLLGRVFNWALERELIAANPAAKIKKPRTKGATTFYSEAEVANLLTWAAENDPTLHPIVAFAYYTGCRKGEIAALRWSDIDWQGARIIIHRSWRKKARKSGAAVVVSVHPHLAAVLAAHQKRTAGQGDELVFPAPANAHKRSRKVDAPNGWMRDKYDDWGIDAAIAAKGVRRFHFPWHSFRHTHGTDLANQGAGLEAIRLALGQATLQMAQNYIHLAAERVREHVAKLPTLGPVAPAAVTSLDEARKRVHTGGRSARSGADAKPKTLVSPDRFELSTNGLKAKE